MSHAFGFNRADKDADYLSIAEIVHDFVDAVSKNGNLLLNIGPRGEDAQIPAEQVARLEGFGAWLTKNGEAIYGTRPWARAEGKASDDLPVRFTRKGDVLYAIVLGKPKGGEMTMHDVPAREDATVMLLGHGPVAWRKAGGDVVIALPPHDDTQADPVAISFSISKVGA